MHTSSQLAPTGARGVRCGTRRRDNCPAYVLPTVRELPPRLEPVAPDTFGGLVSQRNTPPLRAVLSTTTHLRGAHS